MCSAATIAPRYAVTVRLIVEHTNIPPGLIIVHRTASVSRGLGTCSSISKQVITSNLEKNIQINNDIKKDSNQNNNFTKKTNSQDQNLNNNTKNLADFFNGEIVDVND